MDEQVIKDAQYRKGLSIAFFNATNNAIELVKNSQGGIDGSIEDRKQAVAMYRDWLLDEHKKYYAEVIAKVGPHFSVEDTIAKLKATTDLNSLAAVWRAISADERAHPEVLAAKDELKDKYEKA